MSQLALVVDHATPKERASARALIVASLALAAGAAILAGWMPLGFAIVTVFLFAGPHNWIEARYFLSRLPSRLGKLRSYFLVGFAGVFGLTAAFAALPLLSRAWGWEGISRFIASAGWNSMVIIWVAVLAEMRARQHPRRDWVWALPIAMVLLAVAWVLPGVWTLCLLMSHPLIALWILDRELRRTRPELRRAYHVCLACLPFFVVALCWRLADKPSLPGDDVLTLQIAQQAGAGLVPWASSHLIVAVHSFLQMIHYGVWLIAIPLIGLRSAPWSIHSIPLARRAPYWRLAVAGLLVAGAFVVLVLWGSFLADYPTTRNVYFIFSWLHVLAEFPFLLRAL
jgi:hypothetical protein